jgi:hypothetical protein
MKKLSRNAVSLFASATAVCAFAVPSMASASSWGVIGSEHTLDSPNIAFVLPSSDTTVACRESQLTVNVTSAAAIEIRTATFRNCTGTGIVVGTCTATPVATGLPWTATAVTTSNIQIHRVQVDVLLETHPGGGHLGCTASGVKLSVTGTLTAGTWNGNVQHEILFNNSPGLASHSALGLNQPITLSATLRDTQQTLTVTG